VKASSRVFRRLQRNSKFHIREPVKTHPRPTIRAPLTKQNKKIIKAHTGGTVVLRFVCTGIEAVFLLELHETETRFLALTEENTLRACANRKQRTPGNKQDKATGIYRILHRI